MSEWNDAIEEAAQVIEVASLTPGTDACFSDKPGCAVILGDAIRAKKRPVLLGGKPVRLQLYRVRCWLFGHDLYESDQQSRLILFCGRCGFAIDFDYGQVNP